MTKTSRLACAASAAALAVVALSSGGVRADEGAKRQDAQACAAHYVQVVFSTRANEIVADFDAILEQEREMRLAEIHGFDGGRALTMAMLASPENQPLVRLMDSGDPALEDMAIGWLAACDQRHGFTPVFARKAPARIDDLGCAANYRTLGAARPATMSTALSRASRAIRAYMADPPPAMAGPTAVTQGEILAEVGNRSKPRVQRIMAGQEDFAVLLADVHACDARYGLEPMTAP